MTRSGPPSLASLLERHRDDLLALVRREARGLLRRETPEDLVQDIHLRALGMEGRFEFQGEREFAGWLAQVARRHIADRHDYWRARRRDAGRMLRLTAGAATKGGETRVDPPGTATGPSTFVARKEQIALAIRALGALPPRDREIVRWMSQGVLLAEVAKRLGLSYDAAKHANARAVERFRKAFALISRRGERRRGTR